MTTATAHDERELDGLWFLLTFLYFGRSADDPTNPVQAKNIHYVEIGDDGGFSEVNVTLDSGDTYHVTVEKVSA